MELVRAINEIHANVWAVFIIVIGAVLVSTNQKEVGATLLTGGFALFRQSTSNDGTKA